MTKAKKLLITLPALSSCLCTIMGCKEDKPLDKENIVFNNENIVTRANSFEGLSSLQPIIVHKQLDNAGNVINNFLALVITIYLIFH